MLKQKFSKFKRVCTFIYLPQILKHTKCGKNKIYKNRNVQHVSTTNKSKDLSTEDKGVKTIFTKNVDINGYPSTKEDLLNGNIITPAFYNIDRCTKCQSVIDKIFGKETPKYQHEENETIDNKLKGNLQATTATIEEEKLAQKIEVVDETSHVEAPPKIEGLNSSPKVLGQEFINYKKPEENVISDGNYDDVAKRCLKAPVGEIDKMLLNEFNISPKTPFDKLNGDENKCAEEIISSYENDNINPVVYVPERFQPLHLHTLPLFTIEDGTKDFKESLSKIYLKAGNKEPIPERPSPISPYDTPAMPFYEYINKERIDESRSVFDVIPEIQISNPIAEEKLTKEAQSPSSEQSLEKPKDGTINPQSLNCYNNSSLHSNETYDTNLKSDHVANIFSTYQLLTSTPNHPTDSQAGDVSQQSEMQNSAISGVLPNQNISGGYEEPPATAISANQNPGEYFNEEFNFSAYEEKDTPMRTERPASQNVVFSSMQPRLEFTTPKTKFSEDINDIRTFKKACAVQANISEIANKDIPLNPGTVPLSILLKQIRERSQLEYCQNVLNKLEAEVAEVKCPPPDKKEACNPNPCKASPCKSKPAPEVRPCDPCQGPKKKDPCAKLVPFILNVIMKSNVTLDKTVFETNRTSSSINTPTSLDLITEEVIERLIKLGQKLRYLDLRANMIELYEKELSFKFARDFEPWIPIPSWPIPKVEKKRPFLCPKYGCKYPVSRKPSKGKCVPKKNFSLTQLFSSPFTGNI